MNRLLLCEIAASSACATGYQSSGELILDGNDHEYERFAAQLVDETPDAEGLVEIVVGAGGKSHGRINLSLAANSVVQNADTYGVLRLELHAASYDWRFIPVAGRTFTDAGAAAATEGVRKWAWVELNYRPHAYQACALTT